jgi:hypothetical protein
MYFECVGDSSVSDSDSDLNRGTEPIIRFHLGFFLKLDFVLTVSIMGMGMVVSQFSSMDPDTNELGPIYYSYDPYFLVLL